MLLEYRQALREPNTFMSKVSVSQQMSTYKRIKQGFQALKPSVYQGFIQLVTGN
jgi:hypothetical protein